LTGSIGVPSSTSVVWPWSLGLRQYEIAFRDKGIDVTILPN
jgi:hypothetical protein